MTDRQPQRHLRSIAPPAEANAEGLQPPMDLPSERSILGNIMAEGGKGQAALEIALDMMRPEHFFPESHQLMFIAFGQLAQRGEGVNLVSVVGKLRDTGHLGLVGAKYVAEVLNGAPVLSLPHFRDRMERVVDLARRRQSIATYRRLAAEGYGTAALSNPHWVDESATVVQSIVTAGSRSRAVPMSEAMKEATDEASAMADSAGSVYGYSTGLKGLDDATGGCLVPKEFTVIKGKSGEGKSSLSRQMLVNVAKAPMPDPEREGRHIWNACALFSLEMTKSEVARYCACTYGGVDGKRIRTKHWDEATRSWQSNMTIDDWQNFHEAARWIGELPIYIEGNRKGTLANVRAELRARRAELARGIICPLCAAGTRCKARLALLVVDTLQILTKNEPSLSRDEGEADKIDRVARDLGTTAVDFDMSVVALSQENSSGGAYGSPGAIRAHVQTLLSMRYSKKKVAPGQRVGDTTAQHDAMIQIEKCRAGWEGPVPVYYRPAYTRVED